jgi:hypothetical protein
MGSRFEKTIIALCLACLSIPATFLKAEDDKPEIISLLGKELYARPAEGAQLEELQRNLASAE